MKRKKRKHGFSQKPFAQHPPPKLQTFPNEKHVTEKGFGRNELFGELIF